MLTKLVNYYRSLNKLHFLLETVVFIVFAAFLGYYVLGGSVVSISISVVVILVIDYIWDAHTFSKETKTKTDDK